MNIPYLLKILNTNKLSELVANIDLPPLDVNLAIWGAEKAGQVNVNAEKDLIEAITEPEVTFDSDLAGKLLRVMQHYQDQEINITRGRLNVLIKDPMTGLGYGYHEYLMALHYLIDTDQVHQEVVEVPEGPGSRKEKRRPAHTFVFLQFKDNPNEDWNRREVNNWIDSFAKKK